MEALARLGRRDEQLLASIFETIFACLENIASQQPCDEQTFNKNLRELCVVDDQEEIRRLIVTEVCKLAAEKLPDGRVGFNSQLRARWWTFWKAYAQESEDTPTLLLIERLMQMTSSSRASEGDGDDEMYNNDFEEEEEEEKPVKMTEEQMEEKVEDEEGVGEEEEEEEEEEKPVVVKEESVEEKVEDDEGEGEEGLYDDDFEAPTTPMPSVKKSQPVAEAEAVPETAQQQQQQQHMYIAVDGVEYQRDARSPTLQRQRPHSSPSMRKQQGQLSPSPSKRPGSGRGHGVRNASPGFEQPRPTSPIRPTTATAAWDGISKCRIVVVPPSEQPPQQQKVLLKDGSKLIRTAQKDKDVSTFFNPRKDPHYSWPTREVASTTKKKSSTMDKDKEMKSSGGRSKAKLQAVDDEEFNNDPTNPMSAERVALQESENRRLFQLLQAKAKDACKLVDHFDDMWCKKLAASLRASMAALSKEQELELEETRNTFAAFVPEKGQKLLATVNEASAEEEENGGERGEDEYSYAPTLNKSLLVSWGTEEQRDYAQKILAAQLHHNEERKRRITSCIIDRHKKEIAQMQGSLADPLKRLERIKLTQLESIQFAVRRVEHAVQHSDKLSAAVRDAIDPLARLRSQKTIYHTLAIIRHGIRLIANLASKMPSTYESVCVADGPIESSIPVQHRPASASFYPRSVVVRSRVDLINEMSSFLPQHLVDKKLTRAHSSPGIRSMDEQQQKASLPLLIKYDKNKRSLGGPSSTSSSPNGGKGQVKPFARPYSAPASPNKKSTLEDYLPHMRPKSAVSPSKAALDGGEEDDNELLKNAQGGTKKPSSAPGKTKTYVHDREMFTSYERLAGEEELEEEGEVDGFVAEDDEESIGNEDEVQQERQKNSGEMPSQQQQQQRTSSSAAFKNQFSQLFGLPPGKENEYGGNEDKKKKKKKKRKPAQPRLAPTDGNLFCPLCSAPFPFAEGKRLPNTAGLDNAYAQHFRERQLHAQMQALNSGTLVNLHHRNIVEQHQMKQQLHHQKKHTIDLTLYCSWECLKMYTLRKTNARFKFHLTTLIDLSAGYVVADVD